MVIRHGAWCFGRVAIPRNRRCLSKICTHWCCIPFAGEVYCLPRVKKQMAETNVAVMYTPRLPMNFTQHKKPSVPSRWKTIQTLCIEQKSKIIEREGQSVDLAINAYRRIVRVHGDAEGARRQHHIIPHARQSGELSEHR